VGIEAWNRPSSRDDHTAFDDELGLGAKQGGLPEHDVGQLARLERAHMAADAMGDGGIDGVLAYIAFYPEIIVNGCGSSARGRVAFSFFRRYARCGDHSATRPMACESELIMAKHAMSCRYLRRRWSRGECVSRQTPHLRHGFIEVMAYHEHIEVLVDRVMVYGRVELVDEGEYFGTWPL